MLVARSAELGRLDRLLAALRDGHGEALVLHGEPGIGKTTLLDALVARTDGGVTVLRASGVETESELAFSALSDLLAPLADGLSTLPEPQRAALAAALALGPPVPGERLAVCVAALGLLRAAARTRPVLAVVDDIPWADAASRECLEYVARRAGGSLSVLLAARDPWDDRARLGLPELALGPLDDGAAAELVAAAAPDLTPPVAAAIRVAAAGNPLALVELPTTLTPDQRAGVAPLELPLAPAGRLRFAFAERVRALDPPAQRALLVAAAHTGPDLTVIAAACHRARTDVRRLERAEAHGLVRLENDRLAFAHPLVRGAVYRDAPGAERRVVHAALAAVLAGDQRAWHLAAATVGPDEHAALALEHVGQEAAARRAFEPASAALARAARLSPDPERAAQRLLAAGRAAGAGGAPQHAQALLGEAARMTADAGLRARAEHLRGQVMAWSGAPADATALLVREAERAAAGDRVLAATMLADAANGCTQVNDYRQADVLVRRAAALLGDDGGPAERVPVLAMLAWVLALRGRAPEAQPVQRAAAHLAQDLDPLGPHWLALHLLLRVLTPLDEFERAHGAATAVCGRARAAGALTPLGGALIVAADTAFRLGDWAAADAASQEAIQVAGDARQPAFLGYALTIQARLSAAQGRESDSRANTDRARALAEDLGVTSGMRFVRGALGFLELTLCRADAAVAQLMPIGSLLDGSGLEEPTIVPWAPDLIEAHVRRGEPHAARPLLATLERQARTTGSACAGAAAARCRGMLDDDVDATFAAALACDDRRPMPFERARTLLAYGRRLHRAGRRADARARLREAEADFDRLGAAAWAAQANAELRAAGARRRRPSEALTPQEQRVAAAVRAGASNREIAAQLFLSPRTVEFHLRQIYRKLGIRSRTQLATRAAPPPPGARPP
jgi:DNA-binding CsgD family transcriptional regulator